MPIWLIEPAAEEGDPIWMGGPQWSRILVRADSAALARVVAESLDVTEHAANGGGRLDELYGRSAIANEKAYRVVQVEASRYDDSGAEEVLEAERRR